MANTVEFDDIQGLVRFGHGQLDNACFMLLDVIDPVAAGAWLAAAPVTSAVTASPLPERALQIAFTAPGLRALSLPDSVIAEFSREFIDGMVGNANRSRRLGDVGPNDPEHWEWGGGGETPPHLLLMLYSRGDRLAECEREATENEFAEAFRVRRALRTVLRDDREPFGFVDGISQPTVDWEGEMSTDLHERDRYANLLKTGEVLLGHQNEYGLYTERPLLDLAEHPDARELPAAEDSPSLRDLGRNGTYLVLRQLSQDVSGFWRFIDEAAGPDAGERERLAAAMVGRTRDGSPLVDLARDPIPGTNGGTRAVNNFTFDDDPDGHLCPLGAHVRRSNPRSGDYPPGVRGTLSRLVRALGFGQRHPHEDLVASSRFHRLLRRGRAYGGALSLDAALPSATTDAERGLHFVSLGANISRQFEFVQNAWAVSSKFAGLPTETDPLLGNRQPLLSGERTDRFSMPQASGAVRRLEGLPQFVTVRGGAYFFMPGVKALRYIARQPAAQGRREA